MRPSRAVVSLLATSLFSPALGAVTPSVLIKGGGGQPVTVTETSIRTVTVSETCQVRPKMLNGAQVTLIGAIDPYHGAAFKPA